MFDFNKVNPGVDLTPDWILSKVSDAQIFYYYHGRFKIGNACKSSLKKDNSPSVTFFIGTSGRIIYYDFRDRIPLDCFGYVQTLFHCNFRRALEQICEDFGLIDQKTRTVPQRIMQIASEIDTSVKRETLIQFVPGKWTKENLLFWDMYDLSQPDLEFDNVFPVKHLFLNKQEIRTPDNVLRYAKVQKYIDEGVEKVGVKIYSPYDENMKWLSSIPLSVPFGLDNLNYGSNVIMITKSFKDMMVLRKIFTSVIATQNESRGSLPEGIIKHLDSHFDKKIIFWDNDETGVNSCKEFNSLGFGYFNIPNEYRVRFGIKDASDYVKVFGIEALKEELSKKNLL